MLKLSQANGTVLETDLTPQEFLQLVTAASPSPWVNIVELTKGSILVNTFTIGYIYE